MSDKLAEIAYAQKHGTASFTPLELTVADMSIQDWSRFKAQLEQRAAGGVPKGAAEIDQPIAEAHVCPTCRQNLTYQPYMQQAPYRYHAFAVCERCNHALEF